MVEKYANDAAEKAADFAIENALHGMAETRKIGASMPTELKEAFTTACDQAEDLCREARMFLRAPDAEKIRTRLTAVSSTYVTFLFGPEKDNAAAFLENLDKVVNGLSLWIELARTRTTARDGFEMVAA
jgi:hypothetical protein